jgi:peptidoglycan hydrolase-like protein with peptidoglycan-binding domain
MSDRAWLSVTRNASTIDTRRVQELLQALGFPVGLDGHFGILTMRAVVEFQSGQGLAPDGNVGPATWEALEGKPKRKRARKADGEFKGDDPATAAVDEAWEDDAPPKPKPAAKKAPAKKPAAKKG